MEDLIGQSLGQYHIIERLGEGGMARVYKAECQLEPAGYVALKVIRSDRHDHETLTQVERLEQEAMAAAVDGPDSKHFNQKTP